MPVQLSFEPTPIAEGRLIFSITIPGRLPSWNEILGMEHWARHKFKGELANAFLSALRHGANDCSTRTTLQRSTMLTYCVTLESYLAMRQEQQRLRSAKRRSAQKSLSVSRSKFMNSEPVPF